MNIEWNAKNYTDDFQFVHKYGENVIELIDAPKNSFVIDLGCGNGALTKSLADKGFRVLGIDASAEMLDVARNRYPELDFMRADALSFNLQEKADVIFSNAVFHWIDEQDKLVRNISEQLETGGTLVCEFGGKGNNETVHAALEKAFDRYGLTYPRVFYFPTIGEYTPLLEKSGFKVVYAVLFDRPTEQKSSNGLDEWIRMFVQKPFEGVDDKLKDKIIEDVVKTTKPALFNDGKWSIDYVRIRIKAVKMF